jgi:glyoxylase-like metal-dependent hydrolase (beta-lactamase superfamily II)
VPAHQGGTFNLPEAAPDYFEAAPQQGLSLDSLAVPVLRGKGDHPDSSVVWVHSAQTVVAGDVIFNRTHAFFGDHDDIASWIGLVERVVALKPKTVIAGHSKVLNPPGEIAAAQLAWLKDLQAALSAHQDPVVVKQVMRQKYPDYANDFIFEFSDGVKKARIKAGAAAR